MIRNLIPINPQMAIAAIGQEAYTDYGGWLISPRSRDLSTLHLAPVWAADNDCFSSWDSGRFKAFLERIAGIEGCLFVNCPDVVQDHRTTLRRFERWHGAIARYSLPVAFTLQNGVTSSEVPWQQINAVFIGGDTRFKFSDTVRGLVREARERGKWVHNGRVNSRRRIHYSAAIGCHSFDGTSYLYSVNIKSSLPAQIYQQKELPCF